jgi:hypothetical protein
MNEEELQSLLDDLDDISEELDTLKQRMGRLIEFVEEVFAEHRSKAAKEIA